MRPLGSILTITALATLLLAAGGPGVALAAGDASADESAAAESAMAEPPYASPMREQCTEELRKDARWRAELRNQLRDDIHSEDANLMLRNKRHVVIAYAAIWILAVAFLVLMWWRQRSLTREIEELREQVRRAAKES